MLTFYDSSCVGEGICVHHFLKDGYSRLTNVHVLTIFNPASVSVRYHTYQIIIFSLCLSKDSVLQIKVFLPWNEDLVKALNSTVVYYNQSPSFSFRICLYNITSIFILNILTWIILSKNNVLTNIYINWGYHIQWICMYKMILNCRLDTPRSYQCLRIYSWGNRSTLETIFFWDTYGPQTQHKMLVFWIKTCIYLYTVK